MKPARAHEATDSKCPASSSPHDEREEARDQLTLVLSFFPRVDAKASAILAINTAMLAVLASNAPPILNMTVFSYVLAGITVAMITPLVSLSRGLPGHGRRPTVTDLLPGDC